MKGRMKEKGKNRWKKKIEKFNKFSVERDPIKYWRQPMRKQKRGNGEENVEFINTDIDK